MDETANIEDIESEIEDLHRTMRDVQSQAAKDFILLSHMENKLRRLYLRRFAVKHKN